MAAYAVTERSKWVVDWPGQAVLCVSQKYWTTLVHESIRKSQEVHKRNNTLSTRDVLFLAQ